MNNCLLTSNFTLHTTQQIPLIEFGAQKSVWKRLVNRKIHRTESRGMYSLRVSLLRSKGCLSHSEHFWVECVRSPWKIQSRGFIRESYLKYEYVQSLSDWIFGKGGFPRTVHILDVCIYGGFIFQTIMYRLTNELTSSCLCCVWHLEVSGGLLVFRVVVML